MKLIMSTRFGSTLYGTSTANSDTDIKGIALPTWDQIALNEVPKEIFTFKTGNNESKNTSKDIDLGIFSLHKFMEMALAGDTCAIDMLHTPDDKLYVTSEIWKDIVANRSKFYTKNIETFINYAMGQASKYGVKGSRLNDAKAVLGWIDNEIILCGNLEGLNKRIINCDLSTFPVGEHIIWHLAPEHETTGYLGTEMIEVCNRKILLNSKLGYARDIVQKFYDSYGDRAKKAANDEGVDWKAISHAFRAAYQTKSIFVNGTITYPLGEAEFLREVKLGNFKYNNIVPILEDLIDEVKELREKSTLPEKPDVNFWREKVKEIVLGYVVPRKQYE